QVQHRGTMSTTTLRSLIFGAMLMLCAVIGLTLYSVSTTATEVTGTSQAVFSAASALNAQAGVGAGFMPRCRETVVYIQWGAGVGSGVLTVETAHHVAYPGTWAPLA